MKGSGCFWGHTPISPSPASLRRVEPFHCAVRASRLSHVHSPPARQRQARRPRRRTPPIPDSVQNTGLMVYVPRSHVYLAPDKIRMGGVCLRDHWNKGTEREIEWLILGACYQLDFPLNFQDPDAWKSNGCRWASVLLKEKGLRGVLGWSWNGWTGEDWMREFVKEATATSMTAAWRAIWRGDPAKARYSNIERKQPAYFVTTNYLDADRLAKTVDWQDGDGSARATFWQSYTTKPGRDPSRKAETTPQISGTLPAVP